MPPETAGQDDPEEALREVRGRFVAAFPDQCDLVAAVLTDAADRAPLEGALKIVHRMAGLAGTIGFPTVSLRAAELESRLSATPFDAAIARDLLAGLREAYAVDLMRPPDWALEPR